MPHICEHLACQPISICKEGHDHFKGLELADAFDSHSELCVDVLIGIYLYWEFVTGETRRGSDGPVAIRTQLGWILSRSNIFTSKFSWPCHTNLAC